MFGYAPPSMIDALLADSISKDVITQTVDGFALTDNGRSSAGAMVDLQEAAIARRWDGAAAAVAVVRDQTGRILEAPPPPPSNPSTFELFANTWQRPDDAAAQALRSVTALRYWRMDAHRRALTDAGLTPRAAHALNVLWDASRATTRVGQGFANAGTKGTADLEALGLAANATITSAGIERREQVERATNQHTEPLYAPLDDDASRAELLDALRALPA